MTLEDERVELHLDDAFAKFKQSCVDVTRTIQTTRMSFSGPLTIPSEPRASKQRFRKSRSLLTLAFSAAR